MSLYSDYLKERENIDTYESDNWFFMYKLEDGSLVVLDGYIKKEYRKGKATLNLLKSIFSLANENKCDSIWMHTDTSTNNWENSDSMIKKLGFKYIKKIDSLNYYIMELGV